MNIAKYNFKVLLILKYGILIEVKESGCFYFKKNEFSKNLIKGCCYCADLTLTEDFISNQSLLKIIRDKQTKYSSLVSEPDLLGSFFSKKETKNRVLIKIKSINNFKVGSIHRINNKGLYVSNLGKNFKLEATGDEVCFVYFEETTLVPNWTIDSYMEQMSNYASMVRTIQSDGIKPRHSAKVSLDIKTAKIYLDFRTKIIGNSWFAVSSEHIYYICCDTAINDFSYNIKLNGRLVQVWQMHKALFPFNEDSICIINNLLMLSNIFPDKFCDEDHIDIKM